MSAGRPCDVNDSDSTKQLADQTRKPRSDVELDFPLWIVCMLTVEHAVFNAIVTAQEFR